MRRSVLIAMICGALCGNLAAQNALGPAQQLILSAPDPQAPSNVTASYTGSPGSDTLYYWVVANYPGGESSLAPAPPLRSVGALTASNSVLVSWRAVGGATSYDVLRTTSPTVPTNGCSCVVSAATTSTFTSDTGAALTAWTENSISAASATISVNNTSEANPYVNLRLVSTSFRVPLVRNFTSGTLAAFDSRGNLVDGDGGVNEPFIVTSAALGDFFKVEELFGTSPSLWLGDVAATTPTMYRLFDGLFFNVDSGVFAGINFQVDGSTSLAIGANGETNLPPQSDEPTECNAGSRGSVYFDLEDERLCICVNDGTDFEWVMSDDYSHATGHCSI